MPTRTKIWKVEIKAIEACYWRSNEYDSQSEQKATSAHVAVYRALRDFKSSTIPARTRIRRYEITVTDEGQS